jgi:CMP-N-acetylneuraminic acid synthetase
VSCIKVPHIFHPRSVMRLGASGYLEPYLPGPPPTRRQDKEPLYARNGAAIYITRTDCLRDFIYGGRVLCYLMDEASSIDVDTPADLKRVEALISA